MKIKSFLMFNLSLASLFMLGCGSGGSAVVTTGNADAAAEQAAQADMQAAEDAERARDGASKKK